MNDELNDSLLGDYLVNERIHFYERTFIFRSLLLPKLLILSFKFGQFACFIFCRKVYMYVFCLKHINFVLKWTKSSFLNERIHFLANERICERIQILKNERWIERFMKYYERFRPCHTKFLDCVMARQECSTPVCKIVLLVNLSFWSIFFCILK